MDESGKGLRGRILERCRGNSSWIRFSDSSLQCMLIEVEACGKGKWKVGWVGVWVEPGR